VTAWQSRIPTLQVDPEEATDPVVRARAFQTDGKPERIEAGLRGAQVFITTEEDHLAEAARLEVPTVYVADGLAGQGIPEALGRFADGQLRVVRSQTPFRCDVALRELHEAIEEFAPGTLEDGLAESRKCRERLRHHLHGRLADLGHGGTKILPHAIGVDFFRVDHFDHIGDCRDLWCFADQSFDTVYSSHCLEDLWHPYQALDEWTRVLRPGGKLVLYLPLRDFYPNVGTPGANPGHKDDYIPEDVERFLLDLGHMDVVHAARQEAENSFEIVAQKRATRTWSFVQAGRPRPEVSVLVLGDLGGDHTRPVLDVVATVESCRVSLGNTPFEILVLQRHRLHGDDHAAVHDLQSRIPECRIVEDLDPLPYVQRVERLRQDARGDWLLIVTPGVIPTGDSLATLVRRAAEMSIDLAEPCLVDLCGQPQDPEQAPGSCVLVRSEAFPVGANRWTPYLTPLYWEGLKKDLQRSGRRVARVAEAVVHTPGWAGSSVRTRGPVRLRFDERLIASGPALSSLQSLPVVGEKVLLCILKTLGDCIFALPVVDQLVASIPGIKLTVLTEDPYAWVFVNHPGVAEVLTISVTSLEPVYLQEDAVLDVALGDRDFDRLIILSDRLDNVTYHHSGHDLRTFYGLQAGLAAECQRLPRIYLGRSARERAHRVLASEGVTKEYAVVHTRAGWSEKCPDLAVFEALARELQQRSDLAVLVIGGPSEKLELPGVVNLAGQLTQEESAAVISGANLFIGVDSGPLHIASAFGIPSLAIFAGSSLRVAPPLSPNSVAVQSPGSCALACGVSPCRQATCCAESIRAEHLLPHLKSLLEGQPGRSEWIGESPALLIRGPEGPELLRSDAACDPGLWGIPSRYPAYQVSELPSLLLPAPTLAERTAPAPAIRMPPLDETRVKQLLHQALEPWIANAAPASVSTEGAELLAFQQRVGDTIAATHHPVSRVQALRCLVIHAVQARHTLSVLKFMYLALDACGTLIRGAGGRPRPAFKATAAELLRDSMTMLTKQQDYLVILEHCIQLYEGAIGTLPEATLVISLAARASDGCEREGLLPTLQHIAEQQRSRLDDLDFEAARDLGNALARLGAWEEAETLYTDLLASTPLGRKHKAPFLLSRALLRSTLLEKVPLALMDLEELVVLLEEDGSDDRLAETVRAMQDNLRRQLLVSNTSAVVEQITS